MSSQDWIERAVAKWSDSRAVSAAEQSLLIETMVSELAVDEHRRGESLTAEEWAKSLATLPQLQEMAEEIANVLSLDDSCRADDVGRIAASLSLLYAELDHAKAENGQLRAANARFCAELERLARYETELERAASLLQGLISIGQVKAIGLLEVAAGVERLGQEKAEDIDRMTKLLGECRPDVQQAVNENERDYELRPSSRSCQVAFEQSFDRLTRIDAEIGGK